MQVGETYTGAKAQAVGGIFELLAMSDIECPLFLSVLDIQEQQRLADVATSLEQYQHTMLSTDAISHQLAAHAKLTLRHMPGAILKTPIP